MNLLVNIDVPELEPAIVFYSSALGLRLNRILDDDVAELHGATCTLYLLRHPPGSSAVHEGSIARDYVRHWTPVHVDFVVDDLVAAASRAEAAGAKRETAGVAWRGSQCITYSDPFGNGFCLIAFEHDTYQ